MSDELGVRVARLDTEAAVRSALEAKRRELRSWAAVLIREIEDQRDLDLRCLDRAASALCDDGMPKRSSPARKRRRSRAGAPTAAALAEKRCDAVQRFLVEQGRPLACAEIRRSLRLSEFSTRSALKRLVAKGAVTRTGTGSATRYRAMHTGVVPVEAGPGSTPLHDARGTTQGRILATLEDRGLASAQELAEVVRASCEEVEKECGTLIREEEIHMARRGGRPVYVTQGAA